MSRASKSSRQAESRSRSNGSAKAVKKSVRQKSAHGPERQTLREFHSLGEDAALQRVRDENRWLVLTHRGKPSLVVMSTKKYEELTDKLEAAETMAAVARSREQFALGKGMSVEEAFGQVEKRLGLRGRRTTRKSA